MVPLMLLCALSVSPAYALRKQANVATSVGQAYDPCAEKEDDWPCFICAPGDSGCFETAAAKTCQNGKCLMSPQKAYDPCEEKKEGEQCFICGPQDDSCLETRDDPWPPPWWGKVVKTCQSGKCSPEAIDEKTPTATGKQVPRDCSRVEGAVWRNSAWRRSVECKCPDSYVVTGESDACKEKAANFDRYFDVDSDLGRDGTCKCGRPADPTGVHTRPHYDCAQETTLDKAKFPKYEDFLETAHSWCNSDLVPKEVRVPEFLRGLYWMKGLALDDIAFCPGIAEWNETTRTARMPVWSSFVVGRQPHEEVPQLILDVSGRGKPWTIKGFGIGSNVLIYSIVFSDDNFKDAVIVPNAPVFRTVGHHDMHELNQTADGTIKSKRKGDIFDRKTWMLGIQTKGYEAVRVMNDDGVIDQDIAKQMRETENKLGITYMRYAPTC